MDIFAFVDRSDFLQGVSKKNKQLFVDICVPREVAKKTVLFHEGNEGTSFYFLASGGIGIYKGAPDGREVVIKVIQPGEPFAEVILFEESRYPVTAIAVRPSLVFVIEKKQFNSLLDNKDFRNDFITMLMRKQRYLAERIKYLTMHDVEDRFFLFLLEQYGPRDKIVPALSKKDIAAAIGTTPETYSRLITRLSDNGLIRIEGKTIMIRDEFWEEWNKQH